MAKRTAVPTEEAVLEAPPVADSTRFEEFVEHERKAVQEFGKAFMALLPEGVRTHGEAAIREMVEGYRHLFNATIDDVVKTIEKVKLEDRQPEVKG
jgi:hypothetical protein